jgi:hypothetical protein
MRERWRGSLAAFSGRQHERRFFRRQLPAVAFERGERNSVDTIRFFGVRHGNLLASFAR